MKQLGILDTAFINLEQTNTPQHVGGLGIYDPSSAPGGFVRFKQLIAGFERRLDRQPLFRTRLVQVPGGLDRPYWVKDANFDVEFHLRHIALPEPGDWRQLCIQVARLHSRPLDMARPLWEAYIIEGLDNIPNLPQGCFAIYTKMHHALVDGAGGTSFMTLIHDTSPAPGPQDSDEGAPRLVDTDPSSAELLSRATVNAVRNTVGFARGTVRNANGMSRYLMDIARNRVTAPEVTAPRSILNGPVGPHRVFDAAEFPLDGFNLIKKTLECTLNDVAMGVIAGALRDYLKGRDALPEGALAAVVPLNMRTRRQADDENNQVGSVFASLHTDIEDPLQRLHAIAESTRAAKDSGEASPMVDVLRLAGAVSPVIARNIAGLWSRNNLSRMSPLNVSTVVSNVAGPNFALYCAGARLVDYYGLGVLTPGMGLFHLVYSYSGKVTLSVLADRDIMPDPGHYHDCLVRSYRTLYAASGGTAESGPAAVDATRRKRRAQAGAAAKKKPTARRRSKAAKSGAAGSRRSA